MCIYVCVCTHTHTHTHTHTCMHTHIHTKYVLVCIRTYMHLCGGISASSLQDRRVLRGVDVQVRLLVLRVLVNSCTSPRNNACLQHTPAYVSIRQHTPAYVSIRQTLAPATT